MGRVEFADNFFLILNFGAIIVFNAALFHAYFAFEMQNLNYQKCQNKQKKTGCGSDEGGNNGDESSCENIHWHF